MFLLPPIIISRDLYRHLEVIGYVAGSTWSSTLFAFRKRGRCGGSRTLTLDEIDCGEKRLSWVWNYFLGYGDYF